MAKLVQRFFLLSSGTSSDVGNLDLLFYLMTVDPSGRFIGTTLPTLYLLSFTLSCQERNSTMGQATMTKFGKEILFVRTSRQVQIQDTLIYFSIYWPSHFVIESATLQRVKLQWQNSVQRFFWLSSLMSSNVGHLDLIFDLYILFQVTCV